MIRCDWFNFLSASFLFPRKILIRILYYISWWIEIKFYSIENAKYLKLAFLIITEIQNNWILAKFVKLKNEFHKICNPPNWPQPSITFKKVKWNNVKDLIGRYWKEIVNIEATFENKVNSSEGEKTGLCMIILNFYLYFSLPLIAFMS